MKGNTYKWFDGEFLEKLTLEINFFRNLENLNPQLFKKEKYEVLKLIATKNQVFFKEKISESIYKQKELWESLRYLGKLNKTLISKFNAVEDNKTLTYDTRSISTVFKNLFSNLAEPLLNKLPNPPDKYNLKSDINK